MRRTKSYFLPELVEFDNKPVNETTTLTRADTVALTFALTPTFKFEIQSMIVNKIDLKLIKVSNW